MKKNIFTPFLLISLSLIIISCAGDDLNDLQSESLDTKMLTANIVDSDLVGTWDLSKMATDSLVDLNQDGVFTNNLLIETTCFDPMSIIFNPDKSFSSVNSRMDFKAGETDDQFLCMGGRTDTGTWSIEGDVLTLKVLVDGFTYNHTKTLIMNDNTFSFEVNKEESKQYVTDPGDTSVSKVTVVSLEYTKK